MKVISWWCTLGVGGWKRGSILGGWFTREDGGQGKRGIDGASRGMKYLHAMKLIERELDWHLDLVERIELLVFLKKWGSGTEVGHPATPCLCQQTGPGGAANPGPRTLRPAYAARQGLTFFFKIFF